MLIPHARIPNGYKAKCATDVEQRWVRDGFLGVYDKTGAIVGHYDLCHFLGKAGRMFYNGYSILDHYLFTLTDLKTNEPDAVIIARSYAKIVKLLGEPIDPHGLMPCAWCLQEKPFSSFEVFKQENGSYDFGKKCSDCRRFRSVRLARASDNERRIRELTARGSHTEQEWREVVEKYGNRCLRCGAVGSVTKDHVVPLAVGGSNDISNLQPLCGKCNSWKRTQIIDFRDNPTAKHPEVLSFDGVPVPDPRGGGRGSQVHGDGSGTPCIVRSGVRNGDRLVDADAQDSRVHNPQDSLGNTQTGMAADSGGQHDLRTSDGHQ